MAKYTPEQFGDLLDRFAKGLPEAVGTAMFLATREVGGMLKSRIHNDVTGTKDIKGKTRKYKSDWKKVRANPRNYELKSAPKSALQTNVVDHIFTGTLMGGYDVVKRKKVVDVVVKNPENIRKIKGNEKHYNNPVWEADKNEEKIAREVFQEQIFKYINKFFDTRG